ncbi:MAG: formylmethanofuran dehydrogenase subunit [Rhodospirillales bacterium]|nr:formylmethanofuran dehydrogenase subunit [Rhodospirillales bacterium]
MITLALRSRPPGRLSLAGVTPDRLAALDETAIAKLPVRLGNRQTALGDWFDIRIAGAGEDKLVISGAGGDRLDQVGGMMASGELTVEGDVGARAGLAMTGGRLTVSGSAGDAAATAMRDGEIRIGGDVGEALGGALPGERVGMRGGTVVVARNAQSGVGDRMRRGLVVVVGSAGAFCGARLAAGTIVVGGGIGDHPGIAMRRGSIVALGAAPRLAPSFADCGVHDLIAQHLLARRLALLGLGTLASRIGPLRRFMGDQAEAGRGEILVPR